MAMALKLLLLILVSNCVVVLSDDNAVVFVKEKESEEQIAPEPIQESANLNETPEDENYEHELFIPSKVWQKVKPGQMLPSGLHYRINLQTGEKEAKLLDDKEQVQESKSSESTGWVDQSGKFNYLSDEELKAKLVNMPDDGPKNENSALDLSKFKDIEELKKDFEDLNHQIQTESEIVQDIVQFLRSQAIDNLEKSVILTKMEDLTYYTHQIDNAQDFILHMNGLGLIKQVYNHSDTSVKRAALTVLTSCLQSNQKLKVYAFEDGQILQFLTRALDSNIESSLTKSAFNALSAFLRNFPFAQKVFGDMNGYQLLCKATEKGFLPSFKVAQLEMDLINEANYASIDDDHSDATRTLNRQYQLASVGQGISCTCQILSETFRRQSFTSNLNSFETLIDASKLFVSENVCQQSEVKQWLEHLQTVFKDLMLEKDLRGGGVKIKLDDDQMEYRKEVLAKLQDLLKAIMFLPRHPEL
ncbi:nucleotide exchange factor SIL1-like [Convolutriloba macropyga]|uniref:nucleotide exchange factor SIL1-like n=1 Tax=Convolutriloba macropyga TaxID=536237 RepID=UPI003F5228E2